MTGTVLRRAVAALTVWALLAAEFAISESTTTTATAGGGVHVAAAKSTPIRRPAVVALSQDRYVLAGLVPG